MWLLFNYGFNVGHNNSIASSKLLNWKVVLFSRAGAAAARFAQPLIKILGAYVNCEVIDLLNPRSPKCGSLSLGRATNFIHVSGIWWKFVRPMVVRRIEWASIYERPTTLRPMSSIPKSSVLLGIGFLECFNTLEQDVKLVDPIRICYSSSFCPWRSCYQITWLYPIGKYLGGKAEMTISMLMSIFFNSSFSDHNSSMLEYDYFNKL